MPANGAQSDDGTLISGQRVPHPPPTGASLRGKSASLPGYSEAGLVERTVDRYEVVKQLGAGGMGEVSLVQDHDIDRKVAVKFLHADLAEPALVARFIEEIHTVGRLEHPNIVPIHDAGRDDAGRYFFVMKHVDGETLETIIEKLRAGDPAYVARYNEIARVEIMVALLHALKFAEAKGIVHRDLKPANVMIGRSGEVVVMDWGLAKSVAAGGPELPALAAGAAPASANASGERLVQTQLGSVMGTPKYMSPEQAMGRNEIVDARSDLYSASVLFLELLSLEHYLDGREKQEEVLAGAITAPIPPWPGGFKRRPLMTPAYYHICAKGMQKDPAKRFQNADEMIARIHMVQDGTAPIECPSTALRRPAMAFVSLADHNFPMAALITLAGGGLVVASLVSLLVRFL